MKLYIYHTPSQTLHRLLSNPCHCPCLAPAPVRVPAALPLPLSLSPCFCFCPLLPAPFPCPVLPAPGLLTLPLGSLLAFVPHPLPAFARALAPVAALSHGCTNNRTTRWCCQCMVCVCSEAIVSIASGGTHLAFRSPPAQCWRWFGRACTICTWMMMATAVFGFTSTPSPPPVLAVYGMFVCSGWALNVRGVLRKHVCVA